MPVKPRDERTIPLTPDQKDICRKLLSGDFFLRKMQTWNRNIVYRLYDNNANPVQNYSIKKVDAIDTHFMVEIFRKDGDGKITMNLKNIRSLHGRCWIKQTYKYYLQKRKQSFINKQKTIL
jgi:hypothetical protein